MVSSSLHFINMYWHGWHLSLYHKILWPGLALLLPEWLIYLSVPQDHMAWLVFLLPEWLISLSIPWDPMTWTGTAAVWKVGISLCTLISTLLSCRHCCCLNGWHLSLYHKPKPGMALSLPEWLTSLSVPQDPMVWLVLPLPEWFISTLCVPQDPPALDWHCWCLNSWCSYIMVLNMTGT